MKLAASNSAVPNYYGLVTFIHCFMWARKTNPAIPPMMMNDYHNHGDGHWPLFVVVDRHFPSWGP